MSRASSQTWLDTTSLTKNPLRTFTWFMMGASVAAFINAYRLRESGYDRRTYILHKRVAENESTHAVLRTLKYHLHTRKMSVWDASPQ